MSEAAPDFTIYILVRASRVAGKARRSARRASINFQDFDLATTPCPSLLVDATELSALHARHGEAPGNRADGVMRRPMLEQGHGFLKCVDGRKIYFCRNGLSGDRRNDLEVWMIVSVTRKDDENGLRRAMSNLSQDMRLEGALVAAHACDVEKALNCSVE